MYLIAWLLIGFITTFIVWWIDGGDLTVEDLFIMIIFTSLGVFTLVTVLYYCFNVYVIENYEVYKDTVIWERGKE